MKYDVHKRLSASGPTWFPPSGSMCICSRVWRCKYQSGFSRMPLMSVRFPLYTSTKLTVCPNRDCLTLFCTRSGPDVPNSLVSGQAARMIIEPPCEGCSGCAHCGGANDNVEKLMFFWCTSFDLSVQQSKSEDRRQGGDGHCASTAWSILKVVRGTLPGPKVFQAERLCVRRT